jgi:hypothetical protein
MYVLNDNESVEIHPSEYLQRPIEGQILLSYRNSELLGEWRFAIAPTYWLSHRPELIKQASMPASLDKMDGLDEKA